MINNTVTRNLSEILRPSLGLGGYEYEGPCRDFRYVRQRHGDEILEQAFYGGLDFPASLVREFRYSVKETLAGILKVLKEHSTEEQYDIVDDIPQGFSVVE